MRGNQKAISTRNTAAPNCAHPPLSTTRNAQRTQRGEACMPPSPAQQHDHHHRQHRTSSSSGARALGAEATHEARISELAAKLQASLRADPFEHALVRTSAAAHSHQQPPAGACSRSTAARRTEDVFEELLACDQANRLSELMQDASFKEREVHRLREALSRAQLVASCAQQRQAAAEAGQQATAATASSLTAELQALQAASEQQAAALQRASAAKAAAEHAGALAQGRASSAEALLAGKSAELQQLQGRHKQAASEHAAELDRLRQQLQAAGSKHAKQVHREQEQLRQLQAAAASLVECKAGLASEQAAREQLQRQLDAAQRELDGCRLGRQAAEAGAKQLEQSLADAEGERRVLRAKYINLGARVPAWWCFLSGS